jgi:hypothetical protein
MLQIIHQKDQYQECWMINGLSYKKGLNLKNRGFNWMKGPQGGVWHTQDKTAIEVFINFNIPVIEI